jgi:hypothetical protein
MTSAGSSPHLSVGRLIEYYLGQLPAEATTAVEDHIFACAACGAQLDALHRTADAMVSLVRRGEIASGATTALANRMARDRLNVRHYLMHPGEVLDCTVGHDDDFMMGRLVLPEGDFERLDMRILDANGSEMMRVDDIPIDARSRHAMIVIPGRPAQAYESAVSHYVLVIPSEAGDREVARYVMAHIGLREA